LFKFSNQRFRKLNYKIQCPAAGGATKQLPLEIIKAEEYKFYEEARNREKQIKKYKSGEALKKIIKFLNVIPPMAGC